MTSRMNKQIIAFVLMLCMLFSQFNVAMADSENSAGTDYALSATIDHTEEASEATDNAGLDVAESEGITTYTAATANGIEVLVTVTGGVLPENVELVATEIGTGDDEAAEAVGEALDYFEVDYDGFVAIDVHFEDETGTEVEPDGTVAVSFSLPEGVLPEGAEDLAVQHLVEDEDGNVECVETVAVETEDDGDSAISVEDDGSVVAEFEVGSFSGFTITYVYSESKSLDLTVYCIYDDETATDNDSITTVTGVTQTDVTISSEITIENFISTYLKPTSAVKFVGAVAEKTPVGAISYYNTNGASGKYSVAGLTANSTQVKFVRGDNGNSQNFDSDHSYLYIIFSKQGESLTPGVYVKNADASTYTIDNTGAIVFDMDTDYYSSALESLAYSVSSTGTDTVVYAYTVVASSESEAATAEAITDLKYSSSAGAWYYVLSDGTSGTLNTTNGETIYFVYGIKETFSGAVLTYNSLSSEVSISSSLSTSDVSVDIDVIADTAYQVNKLSFKTSVDSTSYFYGKDFSYAVICNDSNPFNTSIAYKITYIRYDYSTSTWQYLTSASTTWVDFEQNDVLYFLYYANATTFGTILADYTGSQSQKYVTVEADESYKSSEIISSWAADIEGYTCTSIVVYTGNNNSGISASDYTVVNRIMYASTYSEEIGSSLSGNVWYYNTSESASADEWVKIDDLSHLYYLYVKDDITLNYADGTSNTTTDNKTLSITYPGTSVVETATITGGTVASYVLKEPSGGTFTENGITYQYVWAGWSFADSEKATYAALGITLSSFVSGDTQTLTIPSSAVVTNNEITIYSNYTISPVYEVTYVWEDVNLAPDSISLPSANVYNEATTITLPTFDSEGYSKNTAVTASNGAIYTWLGWYYTNDSDELVEITDTTYYVTKSVTITGKWSMVVSVGMQLQTNFTISPSSSEGYILKNYFQTEATTDTTIGSEQITGITFTNEDKSVTIGTIGDKYLHASNVGTAVPGTTIALPAGMQGKQVTVTGTDSNSDPHTYEYIFSGWRVYNSSTGKILDLDDINVSKLTDYVAVTDSDSGLTYYYVSSEKMFYVTVPANGIEIRAALFKETNSWTADDQTTKEPILTVERQSIDFSTTDAKLGYLSDIEVYIWDGTEGEYVLETNYVKDNDDADDLFYFSYDNYACVDLLLTLADDSPYYIVGVGYTVCYGSSGPKSAKWGDTSNPGISSFYLDNIRTTDDDVTSKVQIYLAKMYTINYEIYDSQTDQLVSSFTDYITVDTTGTTLTLTATSLTDSSLYSPVTVKTDGIVSCTTDGTGHQKISSGQVDSSSTCSTHSGSSDDQANTVIDAFTYSLTNDIKLANATANTFYTISDWTLIDYSTGTANVTSTTYSQGASVSLYDTTNLTANTTLTAAADSNNVITLRATVRSTAVPSGIHTDNRPYIHLIFLVLPAGLLLIYMRLMRRRRKYMDLHGDQMRSGILRKNGSKRMRIFPRKGWFDG